LLQAECTAVDEEIDADDKEEPGMSDSDLFADMIEDDDDDAATGAAEVFAESCPTSERKRDYLVDLFAFARPMAQYMSLFRDYGLCAAGTVVVILTSTAHPGSCLASRELGCETYVLSQRLKSHSLCHAKDIGVRIHLQKYLREASAAEVLQVAKRKFRPDSKCDEQTDPNDAGGSLCHRLGNFILSVSRDSPCV
jgi:hypothetical protein